MKTISQLIDALGSDVDTVRSVLAAQGIKGHASGVRICPIAVYLRSNGFPEAWAGPSSIGSRDTNDYGPDELIKTPEQIHIFMQRFDSGEFPELNAKKESK